MAHPPARGTPKCIGLVGGLGPAATVIFYKNLLNAFGLRGISPRLVMSHADAPRALGLVQAGQLEDLAEYLRGHIAVLKGAGADFALIPAVTPHICFAGLAARSPLPLLNMIDLTAREVARRGLKRVGVFGTRFVMDSRIFGQLDRVHVQGLRPDDRDTVHDIYMRFVREGVAQPEDADKLRHMARALIRDQGVETIVLAGTELSLAFDETTAGFPAIDCGRLMVVAACEAATAL